MMKTSFASGLAATAFWAFAQSATCEEAASAMPAATEEVIDLAELAGLSGGDGVTTNVLTAQDLDALNGNNQISANGQIVNGAVNLSNGAFEGFAGIGNFVINTGNQNNLQSSLAVNIVLAP